MKAKQKVTTIGDRRVLDAVKAAKAALAEYRVICREASRLYHEAECHPDLAWRVPGRVARRVQGNRARENKDTAPDRL
jgi:hypothetical protein